MSSTPIDWLETVDSTNEEAKRWLAKLHDSPLEGQPYHIIAAHRQTAGKGTQGRRWVSNNPENLYCSWVHWATAERPIPTTTDYTSLAAVAVASVLRERYRLPIFIKPINDIYAPLPSNPSQYGKLGGILVESVVQGGEISGLITGLGLNLAPIEDIDGVVTVPTVSLTELLPREMDLLGKEELITAITNAIEPLYQRVLLGQTLLLEELLHPFNMSS